MPSDGDITAPALAQFLADWAGDTPVRRAISTILEQIATSSIVLAQRLSQGRLPGDPTQVVGTNESGDKQKALDMAAHHHFIAALRGHSIAKIISEEADDVIALDPDGQFDLAIDPIDGSGSIGIGAPLGALFCLFPTGASVLHAGDKIIAAGYVSFGHSVDFGFSTGNGVSIATLNPLTGTFHVDTPSVTLPAATKTIAFNASNPRRWSAGLQAYIADTMAGKDGPRGRDFNMRWIAAAVGDLHRILRQGGVFLYPADSRPGYEHGFLRLAYEAFPIAFLMEQAGGRASDGTRRILDLTPTDIHDRVPLIFGSRDEVATLQGYLTRTSPQED
ncbi:class 1 fructose-bisphosphatase [Thioclava sp. SK-1]|uniref:class 1 fructose-bisphosphatase n=1 Tax=Thioclava sp. SK-1 TaxID=1889770 RepID=UPI001C40090D|nr:class 1 fructose-bisphosphatase [Thioclava sp. SK-1]